MLSGRRAAMTLPRFDRVTWHPAPLPDGIAREAQWAERAAAGAAPAAHLWCGTPGFYCAAP